MLRWGMMSCSNSFWRAPLIGWFVLSLAACASGPDPKPDPKSATNTEAANEEFNPFGGPKNWDTLIDHYEFDCPVTDLVLDTPHSIQLGGRTFTIFGSEMRAEQKDWGKSLRLGVLAGIEDPSERFEWLKESGQSTARQYRSAEIISVDSGPLLEEHPRGIQREGVVIVQAAFFTLPNQVLETEMIKQTWYRSAGGWFVDLKVE